MIPGLNGYCFVTFLWTKRSMEKIIDRFIANENMEEAASKSKDFYIFAGGILRRPQNRRTMKQ